MQFSSCYTKIDGLIIGVKLIKFIKNIQIQKTSNKNFLQTKGL